ncbi:GtrA family protein [Aurantimonas coralicida]|uniref:GtrA family protein n=1 Tax=Aurantimonas coralicida TaxID=182270 RepID=UPI001D187AEC|nr:GtrA family protein [Aurantimonas coralicida]MCC4300242.1 GtrA family protein [Aurantimonas coralicida]
MDSGRSSAKQAESRRALLVQMGRFALVGVAGFAINALIVHLVVPTIGPIWAQAIAFPVAVTATWWLNRRYTFDPSHKGWLAEWAQYVGANVLGWLATNLTYLMLIVTMSYLYDRPLIALAVGAAAGMGLNFVASRRLVFR